VLILSEFAGASQQFKNDALLVNPFDEESVVDTIKKALSMGKKKKQKRMENMQNIIRSLIYILVGRSVFKSCKRVDADSCKKCQ